MFASWFGHAIYLSSAPKLNVLVGLTRKHFFWPRSTISVYTLLHSTPLPQCQVCNPFIYTATTLCYNYCLHTPWNLKVAQNLGNRILSFPLPLKPFTHANTSCLRKNTLWKNLFACAACSEVFCNSSRGGNLKNRLGEVLFSFHIGRLKNRRFADSLQENCPVFQFMSGLCSVSQGNPRMICSFPNPVTISCSKDFLPFISRLSST